MIKEEKSLSMAEVQEFLQKIKNSKSEQLAKFIKKFIKMNAKEAKNLKKTLLDLGIIKLREKEASKIIDFMPEDPSDIRKIFAGTDVNHDQNEIEKNL